DYYCGSFGTGGHYFF
nr:immunoglobulin light chain junction region [Macaca mulatta]MOW61426.1 immunoglobulin light chain junction region [Macaca mulatta]